MSSKDNSSSDVTLDRKVQVVAAKVTSVPSTPRGANHAEKKHRKPKQKDPKSEAEKLRTAKDERGASKGVKQAAMQADKPKKQRKHKSKSGDTSSRKSVERPAEGKKEVAKPVAMRAELPTKAALKEYPPSGGETALKVSKSAKWLAKRSSGGSVASKAKQAAMPADPKEEGSKSATKHSKKLKNTKVVRVERKAVPGHAAKSIGKSAKAKLATMRVDAKPAAVGSVEKHSGGQSSSDSQSKFRRLPRYTCEQVQKEWRSRLSKPQIQANPPANSPLVARLVRDSRTYGFCAMSSGRFASSHAWYAICSPMGDVLVEENLDFDRMPGVSKLLKDSAIIKVPHEEFRPEIFGDALRGALLKHGFSLTELKLAKTTLWERSSGQNLRLGSEKGWSESLTKKLASDLCAMVWAGVHSGVRLVKDPWCNVLPHVRLRLLELKAIGDVELPAGPVKPGWVESLLGETLKGDIYYTKVEDLDLPDGGHLLVSGLASVTQPTSEIWKRRSVPNFRRKGIEKALYRSSQSCRFCAGSNVDCVAGNCPCQTSCSYPLCADDSEPHAILTCNSLLSLCDWCGRRGHAKEDHSKHNLATLEAYFLLFAKFGLKTGYLYLANDAKLGQFVNSNAWRYGLFPLAPYEYPKMPVVLGLRPPRVAEHSIAVAGQGVSQKAEKRKAQHKLRREAKRMKWAEATELMKPKVVSRLIEFTPPSPQGEPSAAEVAVDDVSSAISNLGLVVGSQDSDTVSLSAVTTVQSVGSEVLNLAEFRFGSVSSDPELAAILADSGDRKISQAS